MGSQGLGAKILQVVGALSIACAQGLLVGSAAAAGFGEGLASAALERTSHKVRYDPSYVVLDYPGGDVPDDQGVCSDVVVRAYRRLGIDLQRLVHLDMRSAFDAYPTKWGLTEPNPNIDHRRVLNLQIFFSRHGTSLPVTNRAADYRPGDLVTSRVPPALPHIAIVANKKSRDGRRYMIVHNIGLGPKLEDGLFRYPITGHYRFGRSRGVAAPKTRAISGSMQSLFLSNNL